MIDQKDIDKLVNEEMELFNTIKKIFPNLEKYENEIRKQFFTHYKIFHNSMSMYKDVIYRNNFFLFGFILRSLNLYRGCLWAFGNDNPHTFYNNLRGQCETLALINYCINNPQYIKIALIGKMKTEDKKKKIVNAKTMVEKLNKKYLRIFEDYDQLCDRVHPNPESLFTNFKKLEKSDKSNFTMSTKVRVADPEHSEAYLLMLLRWTDWIFKEIEDFVKIPKM